jgi:hypothetical protein
MPIKTKRPKKEPPPKKGTDLFLVGVDEDYIGSPKTDKIPESVKKAPRPDPNEEIIFEPSKLDIAKFRDVNFSDSLMTDIDTDQIASELVGWGINFDTLSNPETGELDFAQCEILNDYIEENADYTSLTIVDILAVIIKNCEFDWRRFTSILNEKNFDLLKLELAMRFHKRSSVGGATAFVHF